LPSGSATLAAAAWPFVLATVLASAGPTALVVRRSRGEMAATIAATRAAAAVAQEAAASLGPWDLHGPAREAADAIVAGAIETLTRLADEGWDAILGEPIGGPHRARLGADAVVERTEAFDPFEAADLTSGA
jgi:hypothetical protein